MRALLTILWQWGGLMHLRTGSRAALEHCTIARVTLTAIGSSESIAGGCFYSLGELTLRNTSVTGCIAIAK